MKNDLGRFRIVMQIGLSCALTVVLAVGIFMVIRFAAWVG